MIALLSSAGFWHFTLISSLGALIVFDLWCFLTRAMGIVIFDWSLTGRWLIGKFSGRRHVCDGCHMKFRHPPRASEFSLFCTSRCGASYRAGLWESLVGWLIHYGFVICLCALLPLLWGQRYLAHPTLAPTLLIGFCLPSIIGQIFTLPALCRAQPQQHLPPLCRLHVLMLVGNALFTMTLFASARDGVAAMLIQTLS